jgi:hypothetical protein
MTRFCLLYTFSNEQADKSTYGTGIYGKYAGRSIDEPLPSDFYKYSKYLLGLTKENWSFEEYVDLPDGNHYIILGFSGLPKAGGRIVVLTYDLSRILVDANYVGTNTYENRVYKVEFKVSGTSITNIAMSYDVFGEPIGEGGGGENPNQINVLDVFGDFMPMIRDMMKAFMQIMIMFGFMNAMLSMISGMVGAI